MKSNQLTPRRTVLWAVLAAVLLMAGPALAGDTWKVDPAHSMIGFTTKHLVSKVQGRFDSYNASVLLDGKNLQSAVATADIDAASINTQNEARDKHLKSPDFFDVEKFPRITFKTTSVKPKTADSGVLVGDLTMHGVTRPVELQYTLLGFVTDPWGGERVGFEATGKINRKDFGISWNKTLDSGGVLISEDVTLDITIEAVKEKPAAQPAK